VQHARREVLSLASRPLNAVARRLYGVDNQDGDGRHVLMEINETRASTCGVEDAVLGDELYTRVMRCSRPASMPASNSSPPTDGRPGEAAAPPGGPPGGGPRREAARPVSNAYGVEIE